MISVITRRYMETLLIVIQQEQLTRKITTAGQIQCQSNNRVWYASGQVKHQSSATNELCLPSNDIPSYSNERCEKENYQTLKKETIFRSSKPDHKLIYARIGSRLRPKCS